MIRVNQISMTTPDEDLQKIYKKIMFGKAAVIKISIFQITDFFSSKESEN